MSSTYSWNCACYSSCKSCCQTLSNCPTGHTVTNGVCSSTATGNCATGFVAVVTSSSGLYWYNYVSNNYNPVNLITFCIGLAPMRCCRSSALRLRRPELPVAVVQGLQHMPRVQ